MTFYQFFRLVLTAAIWGSAFIFTRVAAPEFGPFALIEVRLLVAILFLIILALKVPWREFQKERGRVLFLGTVNSAIPFTLYAYATMHVGAGMAAVLNSTVPFFSAIVARVWLGEKLTRGRVLGLFVGFTGVLILLWGRFSFGQAESLLPFAAALSASVLYGYSANYTKRYLGQVRSVVISAVSQVGASLFLLPFALAFLPQQVPSGQAWLCAAALGVFCTGLAYVLFFRLVEEVGATKTITLTFMIPVFGIIWGALILGEKVSAQMAIGTVVILSGTAMATGVLPGILLARAARRRKPVLPPS
jgi:drug/metabolite transporter (DMT)-like permease